MLVTTKTSNGRTIVTLHKDWHPGRIGANVQPKQRNYMSHDALRIQRALLRSMK
jgi:hypothetical protein